MFPGVHLHYLLLFLLKSLLHLLLRQKSLKTSWGSHVALKILDHTRQLRLVYASERITTSRKSQAFCLTQLHSENCKFVFVGAPVFVVVLFGNPSMIPPRGRLALKRKMHLCP